MTGKQLDIGYEFGRGWNLFKQNMSVLVIASLIGTLLTLVTCTVLAGPLTAGMLLLVRRLTLNDPVKPEAGDVLKGFDYFLEAFVYCLLFIVSLILVVLVLQIIPVLGQLASFAVSLFAEAALVWGMMFVVFQKMTALDALKKLVSGITSGELLMPLVLGLLTSLLNRAGGVACGVGALFTIPLGYCVLVSAYETLYGDGTDAATVIDPEVLLPFP